MNDLRLRVYLRSFFHDWISGMCGPISVPFATLAIWSNARYAKIIWGSLAAVCFLTASYRVWRAERGTAIEQAHHLNEQIETQAQHLNRQIDTLRAEIGVLKRKPYNEALGQRGREFLARLSENGKRLMRHLLQNEPLEVGRRVFIDVSDDEQVQQFGIAMDFGIVRHQEVRVGSGMLLRTDYQINPQYRPVLEDLLYR